MPIRKLSGLCGDGRGDEASSLEYVRSGRLRFGGGIVVLPEELRDRRELRVDGV
jgi:hypothetical protein